MRAKERQYAPFDSDHRAGVDRITPLVVHIPKTDAHDIQLFAIPQTASRTSYYYGIIRVGKFTKSLLRSHRLFGFRRPLCAAYRYRAILAYYDRAGRIGWR